MPEGPLQVLVVGLGREEATDEITAELERLRAHDAVRLVHLLVVRRGQDGAIAIRRDEPIGEDRPPLGDHDLRSLAGTIPAGTTAAVALLEHRWEVPLGEAIRRAGAVALAHDWLDRPPDPAEAGARAAADDIAAADAAAEEAEAAARAAERPWAC